MLRLISQIAVRIYLGKRQDTRPNCFSREVRTSISKETYSHLWFSREVGANYKWISEEENCMIYSKALDIFPFHSNSIPLRSIPSQSNPIQSIPFHSIPSHPNPINPIPIQSFPFRSSACFLWSVCSNCFYCACFSVLGSGAQRFNGHNRFEHFHRVL